MLGRTFISQRLGASVLGSALVLLGLALVAAPAIAADPVRSPQPLSYGLDLTFVQPATLSGSETIKFRNNSAARLDAVWIRVWANGSSGCRRDATVSVTAGGTKAGERERCTAVQVKLDKPLAPGAEGQIALRFETRAPRLYERFGRLYGGAVALGNAVPILAVQDNGKWQLPPYSELGESFYSLSSKWQARIRLPRGLTAATTGEVQRVTPLADGATELEVATNDARDFALAVGNYEIREATVLGVKLRYFVIKAGTERLRHIHAATFEAAKQSFAQFVKRFGSYGAPELDIVDSLSPKTATKRIDGERIKVGRSVDMEYPEMVFASIDSAAHEVAHQWWYGIVGDDSFKEAWLDESFATYSDYSFKPSKPLVRASRRAERAFFGYTIDPFEPGPLALARNPIRLDYRLDNNMAYWEDNEDAYQDTVYASGAELLIRLQRKLGKRRMDKVLRSIVAEHRFGIETSSDFVASLRRARVSRRTINEFVRLSRIPIR